MTRAVRSPKVEVSFDNGAVRKEEEKVESVRYWAFEVERLLLIVRLGSSQDSRNS